MSAAPDGGNRSAGLRQSACYGGRVWDFVPDEVFPARDRRIEVVTRTLAGSSSDLVGRRAFLLYQN